MHDSDNESFKINGKHQRLFYDIKLSELIKLPEIRYRPVSRAEIRLAKRVKRMLELVMDEVGMETLKDFRTYIQENGWKRSPKSSYTRFPNIGLKSIEYFNNVLKKYGIEPIGPLFRTVELEHLKKGYQNISDDTKLTEIIKIPEIRKWPSPRVRNRMAIRIYQTLELAIEEGLETLRDIRNYVENYGWTREPESPYTWSINPGNKTIEYFNEVLKKYGLETIRLPLYEPKLINSRYLNISDDTKLTELMKVPEFRYRPPPWTRNRMTKRANRMLKNAVDMGMETLKDLRAPIKERGWKNDPYKNQTIFHGGSNKTIEYFNEVLKKYGLEPIEPSFKESLF